jgi:hypothetical protein
MPKTSPFAPRGVLTAHTVFDPSFNFDFLREKAVHELNLSFTEGQRGQKFFLWHAMNFSVSIHAIADYFWWVKEIGDAQWNNDQNNFVHRVAVGNDCIDAFLDISNTYKHSHRIRKHKIESLTCYPDSAVIKNSDPPGELELRNCIIDRSQPKDSIYWPVITTKKGRVIYYRYAAESALGWWCQYERTGLPVAGVAVQP